MRIAIDLQSCQNADTVLTRDTLTLVQQMVRNAGDHTIYLAFSNQFPARIEMLRNAFRNLLPAQQVLVYDTPSPDGTSRVQSAIELIRHNFFANLGADAVFAPSLFDHAIDTVGAVAPSDSAFLSAVSVCDLATLSPVHGSTPARMDSYARQQASLQHAALVFAGSAQIGTALRDSGIAPERVVEIAATQDQAARQILDALEQHWRRREAPALPEGRPPLAYVSPLPPQQSGIADYSAELVAELAHYYDVHLIVPDTLGFEPELGAQFPVHTTSWFDEHAQRFDRILYHFGNSDVHQFMFGMLERHPGIVVLHDFFLSNVIDNMELHSGIEHAFSNALFYSHGYSAIADKAAQGRNAVIWKYPANKAVLDAATGIIVHSRFSVELAETWYGISNSMRWRVLPLMRGEAASNAISREAARDKLGFGETDFVICSFGMLGSSKLNDKLLDAFLAMPRTPSQRCHLVYVGADDPSEFGIALHAQIEASGLADFVSVTGFVSAQTYHSYLQAADLAVQLRGQTRGETSASVLDCLLHGVATIVNANGANASLPTDVVCMLPDQFAQADLVAAMTRLRDDAAARSELAQRGKAHVHEHHAPARVGAQYVTAIEAFTRNNTEAHYRALLRGMQRIGAPNDPRHYELVNAAKSIAANQPGNLPPQLFIDISAVAQFDLKTGIQRVVRSILLALISSPPPGYRIEPVYGDGGNRRYRYARKFTLGLIGEANPGLEDTPIEYHAGDIFLGLDLVANCTSQNETLLTDMRNRGVRVLFVVYDILPLLLPNAFPYGTEANFREYIETITRISDGLVCISQAVADELAEWIGAHAAPRRSPLELGYFHLGADISASVPSKGLPPNADQVFAAIAQRPTILMVGTVEPRKGHEQALAAFELLWSRNVEVNLVIVGKPGWLVEPLIKRLNNHRELNRHLFWLAGASDEMLTRLYESASGLLAASIGEGFGLPLIEAAQHKLPIIARDIPVFREVSKEHAFYFEGTTGAALAAAVEEWLDLFAAGVAPLSEAMPWLSWAGSARELMSSVVDGKWYRTISAPSTSQQLVP